MKKPSYKFYRFAYRLTRVLLGLVYRYDIRGRENIPAGAAMVCSNHSNTIDPILVAYAFGIGYFLRFIAKVELFKPPVVSSIVSMLGAVSVDRGVADVGSIKNTLGLLKNGEKVAIFPEGTRVSEDDSVMAKNGAIKLAERAGVPIVPVFVPRKKPLFRKLPLIIGEPYHIEKQDSKRSQDDYSKLAGMLMAKIEDLNPSRGMV